MVQVSDFRGILSGSSINGTIGIGAFLSFSFPEAVPGYLNQVYSAEGLATFRPFSEVEKDVARRAIDAYAATSGLTVFEVAPQDGDVKFMNFSTSALGIRAAGFAYYPDNGVAGFEPASDIFINTGGGSGPYLVLHELAHALGLKHVNEGELTLAPEISDVSHTVMSLNFNGSQGDVPGTLDAQALSYLYGDPSAKGRQVASWSWDAANQILTQAGDDGANMIFGLAGADVIHGGDGADRIIGRSGPNRLYGDGGDDTISGGSGVDLLEGGDGNDTIDGINGDDRLIGGLGADRLRVGDGNSVLEGGDGNDDLSAGVGANMLDGGAGDDRLSASDGNDRLFGGTGNDTLRSGDGNNSLDGGDGDDMLLADGGDDILVGGTGNDVLRAGAGNNSLDGGDGNDTLTAGAGNSTLLGGAGDDSISIDMADGIRFVVDGGAGTNRLTFNPGSFTGSTISLADYVADGSILGGISEYFLYFQGRSAALSAVGSAVRDNILLGAGGDTVRAGDGADSVNGNDGDDILFGEGGNDGLSGGLGVDMLDGGPGDDYLNGDGSDFLYGGAGRDNLVVTIISDTFGGLLDGGDGEDFATISFAGDSGHSFAVSALNVTGVETVYVSGGDGNDRLVADVSLPGLTLDGGSGDDMLRLGGARASADGGEGADLIYAGTGFSFLFGDSGADRFIFASLATSTVGLTDQIEDFETGIDRIDISALNATNVRISGSGTNNYIRADTTGGQFQLFVRQAVSLSDIIVSVNRVDGTDGPETLTGTADSDVINAGGGNDILSGLAGDDMLLPGGGRDVVDGGTGDDTIVLNGKHSDYMVLDRAGQTFLVGGIDGVRLTGVEQVRFADMTLAATALGSLARFDGLRYIASHADLIFAFGADTDRALDHFVGAGFFEGRAASFDALRYIAANADLARFFGLDGDAATLHYLQFGIAEGRPTSGFDPLLYAASNPDVARALGADPTLLLRHYLAYGADEGRTSTGFDAIEYGASNPDVVRAVGLGADALAAHYVSYGLAEGRATASFDPLLYAATNPDVARALGLNEDALAYHYVASGIAEGRATTGFDPVAYLLSNADLGAAGLGAAGALRHWVDIGVDEGRVGDSLFGREQTSHVATVEGVTRGTIDQGRDLDWYGITLHAGETVTLDLASDQTSDPAGRGLPDPVMILFDAAGHILAQDDNSGPGRDAQIHFTAQSDGLYYIEAAGANAFGFNDVGGYSLTIDSSLFL